MVVFALTQSTGRLPVQMADLLLEARSDEPEACLVCEGTGENVSSCKGCKASTHPGCMIESGKK